MNVRSCEFDVQGPFLVTTQVPPMSITPCVGQGYEHYGMISTGNHDHLIRCAMQQPRRRTDSTSLSGLLLIFRFFIKSGRSIIQPGRRAHKPALQFSSQRSKIIINRLHIFLKFLPGSSIIFIREPLNK